VVEGQGIEGLAVCHLSVVVVFRKSNPPFDFAQGRLCGKKTRQGWGTLGIAELRSLSFASQSALEGLVQGGFGFFVLLLTDAALFVFDFELEEFFFQAFEQL
jgi:hypothetical protein